MSGRKKGKITIRKALENRDTTLFHNIETIWDKARELQERQRSNEGHQQGSLHCETVEGNLGKLISDEEKEEFSPLELFLLSAAACYHDAGKSDDFDERHALVAMKDIFKNPEKYHLTDPQAKVLSFIVGAHDEDDVFDVVPEISPIGNEDVQVRILSALFRLADVLDTDNSRIPQIKVGEAKEDDEKTRFRRHVQGWGYNDESHIIFTTTPENTDDVNTIAKGFSMMQKQIECIVPVLRNEGYPYEIVYSCDDRKIKWDAETESERKLLEMDFYTENEAKIFKGRKIESEKLFKKVIGSNVSLLIGNSGVGKTSLIQAGLFPKLKKMGWKCIWTRPINPDPLNRILTDINANMPEGHEQNDIISGIKELSAQCESDVVLVIDQFEDILRSPPPVKEVIGNTLLSIYGKSFRNVHVLLSYRGDYEAKINSFLDNSGVISPSRFPLIELEKSGAKEALRCIFQTNNVGISDELLERIIEKLEKNSEG
ncbi:MAG: hypothetical protein KAJ55_12625, partial [Anaerolineales bacterium]|nr:hypothetical protein [Anaerolineales bacterium]